MIKGFPEHQSFSSRLGIYDHYTLCSWSCTFRDTSQYFFMVFYCCMLAHEYLVVRFPSILLRNQQKVGNGKLTGCERALLYTAVPSSHSQQQQRALLCMSCCLKFQNETVTKPLSVLAKDQNKVPSFQTKKWSCIRYSCERLYRNRTVARNVTERWISGVICELQMHQLVSHKVLTFERCC